MYKGFNVTLSDSAFSKFENAGRKLYKEDKEKLSETIASYKDDDGQIDAARLSEDWFPAIKADVFLSHSHRDHKLVLGIAGWLKEKFNLRAFIDAAAWGYADDLLKAIDKQYSWNEKKQTYSYQATTRSSSHVHMMLTVALANMLDRCETAFFINTPSSISADHFIRGHATESPWIYSELAMMKLIKGKKPDRESVKAKMVAEAATEALRFSYSIDLSHLTPLSERNLRSWLADFLLAEIRSSGKHPLDVLYALK